MTNNVRGGCGAQVIRVIDGDTLVVEVAGRQERVRLIGIDAPPKTLRPWGWRATWILKTLVRGKKVRLEMDVQPRDRYGRHLAYVSVDGTFVNVELLRSGYAVLLTVPPNVKHVEAFRQAQVEAREKGVGIWREC